MSGVYRFWDTPDGEDFFKKEYWLLKRAFPVGAVWAWFEVNVNRKPVGVLPVTVRYLTALSQPMIIATLYNVTAYMSTRLRRKDDPINHLLAAIPPIWYFHRRLPGPQWVIMSVPLAGLAFGIKQYHMWYPNYSFVKEVSTYRDNRDNTIFADFYSYLWLAIKEKNWITLEEAIKRGDVQSKEEAKEKKLTNYKDGQARGLVRTGDGTENLHTL